MEQCGLVIFDSHGTTDYSGSNQDYTSRANSSYLCINSTSGLTSTDTATKTGSYERSTEMDLFIGMTLSLEGATSVNYLVPKDALDAYGLDSFKMVVVHTDYDRDTGVYSEETRELAAEAELYVAGGAN
ncbi:MAG: hypothetical protein IJK69_01615, partial [Oscillospiraceae bacterium]|nr:hypothetical protein [Oscillospiraceae bacterium]